MKLYQPTTLSNFFTEDLWIEFPGSHFDEKSETIEGCVFWDSHIHYGFNEGTSISDIIDYYSGNYGQYECYLFNALTTNYDSITYTDETKAGTGMVIVRRIMGKVLDVYYIVLYGDITGNGTIGDGMIAVDDVLRVLQHLSNSNNEINSSLLLMAADANHDGVVNNADAQLIMSDSAGVSNINQNPDVVPQVPADVFFELSWLVFDD